MTIAEAVVLGSTYPRLFTRPLVTGPAGECGCGCALTRDTSYGFDVDDFARDILKHPLDPWQRHLVIHACELQPGGRLPRFRQVLVLVARQNGKTEVLWILALFWLWVDRVGLVLATSSKMQTARESWKKACDWAQATPDLRGDILNGKPRKANGDEELATTWGGRYLIAAANEEGGRGITVDRLIMDELRQHHTWEAYSAAVYACNAVPDAHIWMITNAGEDKSVVLNALRDQALDGTDPQLGIFEWSSPEDMEATDPEALAMANPSLGIRVTLDTLLGQAKRAQTAGGEQWTKFLTEVHCRHVAMLNPAVDMRAWAECLDRSNSLDDLRDKVALCLDVSLDEQHASLYAAAQDGDLVRLDAVAAWDGQTAVRQMTDALPELVARVKPQVVGWFPYGPAAAAAAALAERGDWPPPGVKLEPIRNDVAAVCMGFASAVRGDDEHPAILRHGDDPLLDLHVGAAEKLRNGDGWRFTRKGAGQVDAAYAAAGATHLARTLPVAAEPQIW